MAAFLEVDRAGRKKAHYDDGRKEVEAALAAVQREIYAAGQGPLPPEMSAASDFLRSQLELRYQACAMLESITDWKPPRRPGDEIFAAVDSLIRQKIRQNSAMLGAIFGRDDFLMAAARWLDGRDARSRD